MMALYFLCKVMSALFVSRKPMTSIARINFNIIPFTTYMHHKQ